MRKVLCLLVVLSSATILSCSTATNTNSNSPAASANQAVAPSPSKSAGLSSDDRDFVKEAATGGMAEVELGRLAAQKAKNPDVKRFGQRMVTDHSKANEELKQLATRKGISLPTDLGSEEKEAKEKLAKLSGADFDREYMKMMVDDHDKDVKAFQDEASSASDSDVKAFATKTLPTLQEHQRMAKEIKAKL